MDPGDRIARRALLGVGAVVALGGFQVFGRPDEGGEPDHADDPRWAQFRGVKIAPDRRRGVFVAAFPADMQASNGRILDLGGYLTPLEAAVASDHFIMTRRSSGCPFCPPNEAYEAVEVFLRKKIRYERRQYFVKGRLELATSSDKGLFFQLRDATAS